MFYKLNVIIPVFLVLMMCKMVAVPPHSTYHEPRYEDQRFPQRRPHYEMHHQSRQYHKPPPKKWFPDQGQHTIQGPFRGGRATAPDDRQIYLRIQRSLRGRDIGIIVNQGNVTLQGTVNSVEEKHMIEDRISTMNGVRNINNQLSTANTKAMRYPGGY